MNNTGKIVAAMVAGAAIGAAAGILFAPDKGSETRKKIKNKGMQLASDLKEKCKEGKEKVNDLKENVLKTVKEKTEEFA